MRVNENLTQALKNIENMGGTLALLKSSFDSMIEQSFKSVPEKDKDKFQQFVKESNELMSKATKVDVLEVQRLTNELKLKYGIGVNQI